MTTYVTELVKSLRRAAKLGLILPADALHSQAADALEAVESARMVQLGIAAFHKRTSELLQADLNRYREALEWYANTAHEQVDIYGAGMNGPPKYKWDSDKGERARVALKRNENNGG